MARLPLVLLGLALLAGCDAADPEAASAGDGSVVEGTYTLPDGSVHPFRTRGSAHRSTIGSATHRFDFGTAHVWPPEDPRAIAVSVGFIQYDTLLPLPGRYETRFDDPGREWIDAHFMLTNAPGVHAEGLLDPSVAAVDLPLGTVEVAWDGRVIRGTFDLRGRPFGVADTTVTVAIEGRFEIPFRR